MLPVLLSLNIGIGGILALPIISSSSANNPVKLWCHFWSIPYRLRWYYCLLSDLGAEIQERRTIFSNNRNELLEGIQPSDWPLDGTSEEQNQFIQGHTRPTEQEENTNFLHFSRSLYDRPTLSSNFIRCLRRNNQQTVARIIENGGGWQSFCFI